MTPLLIKLYAYQLFRGLNFLAMISVAHRDIKSSNILLKAPDHAVISDFGLAIALRAPSSHLSGQNSIDMDVNRTKQCGTPRYLSPELLEGQIGVHFADAFRQGSISIPCYRNNSFVKRMSIL